MRPGCGSCPVARSTYYASLDTIEVSKLPRHPETAARWLSQAPKGFVFSVVADPEIVREVFRPGRARDEAWDKTLAIVRALRAGFVVLETPRLFYPQPDRLRDLYGFARACDRGGAVLVWQPSGPWDDALVERICRDLKLVRAVDPLVKSPPAGAVNYFRLKGGGPGRKPSRGHRYHEAELKAVVDAAGTRPTYAYFLTTDCWDDARRLKRLQLPPPLRGRF